LGGGAVGFLSQRSKGAKKQRCKEAKRCLVDKSARGLLLVRAAYRTRRESTHATGESPDAAGWIAGGHSRGTERLRILGGMGNGVPLPMPPEKRAFASVLKES